MIYFTGPISNTVFFSIIGIFLIILSVTLRSRRKFCESCLDARRSYNFRISFIEGSGGSALTFFILEENLPIKFLIKMENENVKEVIEETKDVKEIKLPFWRDWTLVKYFFLLKDNPKFRYLWLASLISIVGDLFSFIANIKLINTYLPDQASIAVAFYFMCWSSAAIISPVAGIIADKFDRRKIMLISDACRCFGALNFLWIRWEWAVYLIFPIEIFQSTMTGIFDPSRSALLPNLIDDPAQLIVANSLDGSTWSIAAALGSSIGGLVVAFLGTDANFIIDSITYGISFVCVAQLFRFKIKNVYANLKEEEAEKIKEENVTVKEENISEITEKEYENSKEIEQNLLKKDEIIEEEKEQIIIDNPDPSIMEAHEKIEEKTEKPKSNQNQSIIEMSKEFFGYMYNNKDVFLLCFMRGTLSTIWGAVAIAHIKYVEVEAVIGNSGSLTLGIYYSVIGFGAFLGPLIAQRYCDQNSPLSMRVWFVIGLFLQCFGIVLSGASFHISWMLVFGSFIRPIGESFAFMLGTTILQRSVKDKIRGRVFAFSGAIVTLGQSIFGIIAGILMDTLKVDLHLVIYIIGAVNLVLLIFWIIYTLLYYRLYRIGRVPKEFEFNGE